MLVNGYTDRPTTCEKEKRGAFNGGNGELWIRLPQVRQGRGGPAAAEFALSAAAVRLECPKCGGSALEVQTDGVRFRLWGTTAALCGGVHQAELTVLRSCWRAVASHWPARRRSSCAAYAWRGESSGDGPDGGASHVAHRERSEQREDSPDNVDNLYEVRR